MELNSERRLRGLSWKRRFFSFLIIRMLSPSHVHGLSILSSRVIPTGGRFVCLGSVLWHTCQRRWETLLTKACFPSTDNRYLLRPAQEKWGQEPAFLILLKLPFWIFIFE